MSHNLLLANAEKIVNECSPRHIQSVIEDLMNELKIAAELRKQVLSLNTNCHEIDAGNIAQIQEVAKRISKLGD